MVTCDYPILLVKPNAVCYEEFIKANFLSMLAASGVPHLDQRLLVPTPSSTMLDAPRRLLTGNYREI